MQDSEFHNWANGVSDFGAGPGSKVSPKNFGKDIILELYNEAGHLTIAYKLFRCWVSAYLAMLDLDANANAVAI
jgi:phage tail-like protein